MQKIATTKLARFLFQSSALFIILTLLLGGQAPADVQAAPIQKPLTASPPSVSLNVPAEAFIGSNVNFTVTFDNPDPSDPGYGPLIDLIIPTNGADGAQNANPPLDGLTFVSATYLGTNVENTVLTFPGSGGVTCVNHPYMVGNTGAPVQVCGDAGDTFVALRLPFGSFTPDQPPAVVDVTVSMSNLADLGAPLTVQARGGYQFGYTPTNDWCCGDDPSLTFSGWVSDTVTPILFTLSKSYNGPEDETATGPNFLRQYTVTAEIAPGQTMNPFNLTDTLPANMQFVSLVSANPGGASCSHSNPAAPDGTLSCDFGSVSGTVTMTFEYYIPLRDAGGGSVIDPSTGDDVLSCNNASGGGTWTPIDTRDTGGSFTQDPAGCEHTLTDKSIAIQKSVSVVGGGEPAPGKYLEYTLDFQISDFFAFNNVVITDVISDGQHFYPGFVPTLEINGNGYALGPLAMQPGNIDSQCNYTGATASPPAPPGECDSLDPAAEDGTTTLIFNVSQEIIDRGQDGKLIGGCVPTGGVAGDPDCGIYDNGPTTGRLVFRTLIQQNFTDAYPSGDSSVDQGDTLNNSSVIDGAILSTSDVSTPTGNVEDDDSIPSVSIGRGSLSKSIYAVNGSTSFGTPVEVKPGDTVTYRLVYTLPTGDVENLSFQDFLPLPVFHVGDPDENGIPGPAWTFDPTVSPAAPAAGVAKFGPSDTFYAYSSITPGITADSGNNRLTFTYGDFDGPTEGQYTIDILFTVTVSDDPFADRLYLTNQANAFEGSTNAGTAEANAIVQIILTEPVLAMKKGIIWTSNNSAVFTPTPPGPVTFQPPASSPRWSGTINSTNLASTPINSDLSGVDAGDLVTFAIVIENTGSSGNGAFDIQLRDDLPANFVIPGGGLNLQVHRGDGTPLSYTDLGGGLFGSGIEITDPSASEGACQQYDPSNGRNIAIVTFDLEIASSVPAGAQIINTATLFNYAGSEGGPDHTANDLTDQATTQVRYAALGKTFTTEIIDLYNSQTEAVIGEFVDYTLTITVPEGTMTNVTLEDNLPAGLAFVDCLSITASPDLSTDLVGGFSAACNDPTNPSVSSPGQTFTFTLGTITNANRDNSVDETIEIVFRAVVLNVSSNQAGTTMRNSATLRIDGGAGGVATVQSSDLTVIEPLINTTKSVSPTTADAGDTVTFTVTLENPASGSTTAYDVTWSDAVPAGLTYVSNSLVLIACPVSTPLTLNDGGAPTLTGSGGVFQPGESCTITFSATVDYSVSPGQLITNTAETRWTSLSGVVNDRSTYNSDSDERTGADGVGGALNDYASQGSANLSINNTAPVKSLTVTSEAHTGVVSGTERVTIGEIVRYRLVVQLPEGGSPNFQIRDYLPGGLTYLDDGMARLALVSNGSPIDSSEPAGSTLGLALGSGPFGSGPWVNGSDPSLVTPIYVLPDQNVGSSNSLTTDPDLYGSGSDPYFKLGTLTNNDSDADGEYIIIEFNALVDNTAAGSNDAGDNRVNNFRVFINGIQNGSPSNNITVRIAEPSLSVTKAVTTAPTDAGDPIEYTLTISAAPGNDRATAFDLSLTDTFDSNLTGLTVSSVVASQGAVCTGNGSGTTAFSHNGGVFAGSTLTFTATCLDPGQTITITISGTVIATAPVGYVIPNTADLTYTSLPGTGTSPNPTGSTTPGSSGADNGERDGSGTPAQNDYNASANVDAPLAAPQIDKLDPTPASYAIGEQVTFNILVTLPEGVTPALQVLDDLPLGLEYVSHQVITTAAGSGGLLAADYNGTLPAPTVTAPGGSGGDLTLDFGDTTTAADNVTNNNSFLVQVVARVLNEAGNQNGTVLTNQATVSWTGGSANDSVNITVIEPELDVQKTVDDATPGYGQTFTYTLTIQHLGSSTANAFDLNISDLLPAGVTVSGAPTVSDAPPGCAGTVTDSSAGNNISLTVASLPLGCVLTIQYSAQIAAPPTNPGDAILNTASMTWTSLAGVDPNERTGADGTGGLNDYTDSDTETVTYTAIDLQITKGDGGITSSAGGVVVYTLNYANLGNGNASGVTITETVPANTTFNAGASTAGWSCADGSPAGTTCTFTVGNLAAGANGSVSFAVTVNNPLPSGVTQISNTASIADDGNNGADNNPANNSSSDTTPVDAAPDLTITKDDGFTVVSPGQIVTYTLTIQNIGTQDATGVVVTDTLPASTTFVSASGGGTESGGVVTWPAFNLAAGAPAVTFTVTIQVNDPFPGASMTNLAHVQDDGSNGTDLNPANNDGSDVDSVLTLPSGDLTKALTATNQTFTTGTSVAIGEIVTYRVTFTVPAGGSLPNLTLTDILDRGLAFVDCLSITSSDPAITTTLPGGFSDACNDPINPTVATEPPGSPNAADAGRRITFSLGTVSNSGASAGTVTVEYTAVVLDSLENQDGVSLNNAVTLTWDSGSLAASAPEATIVEPDFELIKEADRTVALPGSVITFTLTLRHTNLSNTDAFETVLTDTLPPELTYVPGTLTILSGPPGGVTDDSNPSILRVSWANFPLLTGGNRTEAVVEFQATLGNLTPGQTVENTAALEWTSLPGLVNTPQSPYNTLSTERYYDPASAVNVYGVSASVIISVPRLPSTGFAPGVVTAIPEQPAGKAYQALGDFWLEIPKLGVKMPIVGIPAKGEEWDLTWLADQAGWLEGTAYPTHAGNAALTAHVYLSNGQPGPFLNLGSLRYGDQVIVHLSGQRYIFEVRQVRQVSPYSLSPLRHEEYPWLTLITCREYDEKTNSYRYRVVVQAVLTKIE